MNYHDVFSNPRTLLPVIHVQDEAQALRNAKIARHAGADGVFLINHDIDIVELARIHEVVSKAYPKWWIGINYLGLSPKVAFTALSDTMAGLWVDNARIDETQEYQPQQRPIQKARIGWGKQTVYFGGVAFKYQRPVEDYAAAARIASQYMDVVTTSGPGTGEAAHPEKIRTMKQALGAHPLAIASGITIENIADYMGADCFIVATGISEDFYNLDPYKVTEMVVRIHTGA